ncbi:MAG: deoxynucleoside kinase [Myxococcales bacterium]|nr:deoxynucleoside kinase [Myxococcales bacterium]
MVAASSRELSLPGIPKDPETRAPSPSDAKIEASPARYVVIEGPIGVGKTTLTKAFAARLGAREVFEVFEENPFLASFYQDRRRWAFQTQSFFLLSRFRQQLELAQEELFRRKTVSDYLFAKDRIFAALTLDDAELSLYDKMFEALAPRLAKPDVVVYLRANIDVLLERIARRGREYEANFDRGYLTDLAAAYDHFFARYSDTALVVADTTELDLVSFPAEVDALLRAVHSHGAGTLHYAPRAR